MSDFDKLKNELPSEVIGEISSFIIRNNDKMLDRLSELDKRLTNTNFLTNGTGAVAVLTFMGSNPAPTLIKIALITFTLGIIATGIELRALLVYFRKISEDNHRRNQGFYSNKLTAKKVGIIPENVGKTTMLINHYAGWVSQLLFVVGVILGVTSFLCSNA